MDCENIKYCCVTGHRDIPKDKYDFITRELRREIESAIDDGYRYFISGFANGVDLIFAKLIIEYKAEKPDIYLEAALPHPGWKSKGKEYNRLLVNCNMIGVHSKKYIPNCYLIRNKYMMNTSERVIAVYDRRGKSGTLNTILYARAMDRDIRMIYV